MQLLPQGQPQPPSFNTAKWWLVATCLLVFLFTAEQSYSQTCPQSQRVYANAQSNSGSGLSGLSSYTVTDPDNAVWPNTNNTNNYASLAVGGLLGAPVAWIELKFTTTTIPAGSTIYIKIGGNSVNSVLGLLLGANLPVTAYKNATTSADGAAVNATVSNLTTLDGSVYLTVTASENYNAVRVSLAGALLLGSGQLSVYHAFYETPGFSCVKPLGTSSSITGISVGASITNLINAIDNDTTTASAFSFGLLSLVGTLKQTVFFPSLSNPGDAVTITFSIPPAFLNLGLLNNISLTAYNGNTMVGTIALNNSLLSLDLLSLLNSGKLVTYSYVPSTTQPFDRVEISLLTLANVNLSISGFNLYEVRRTAPKPGFTDPSAQSITICSGSKANLSATTNSACNELRWYTSISGGSLIYTGSSFTSPVLTAPITYYVSAGRIGCPEESERVPVTIGINPLPNAPTVPPVTICNNTAATLSVSNSSSQLSYNWYSSAGILLNNPIPGGTSYTTGLLTANTSYSIEAKDKTTNCTSNTKTSTTVTVIPVPGVPSLSIK